MNNQTSAQKEKQTRATKSSRYTIE